MKEQLTLSIIKPDAVKANNIGKIIAHLEKNELKIVAAKMLRLSKERAENFYAIHRDREFFNDLVTFMTSGPVLVMILEGKNAISKNREIMGATDPKKAKKGTIRAEFAINVEANAIHGSDSVETAKIEISFFFDDKDIFISKKWNEV